MFMKQNNFQWLKRIIENIFEIQITKNSLEPLPSFIDAMYNRQYTKAIIEYEKLNPNQKIFFKSSYELALIYNCLLYTSPSPRDTIRSRMPSSA